jgi:hypothetical protein
MVEHSNRDVVDPRLMTPDELLERVALSGPSPRHEVAVPGIGGGGVGQRTRAVHEFSTLLDTVQGGV